MQAVKVADAPEGWGPYTKDQPFSATLGQYAGIVTHWHDHYQSTALKKPRSSPVLMGVYIMARTYHLVAESALSIPRQLEWDTQDKVRRDELDRGFLYGSLHWALTDTPTPRAGLTIPQALDAALALQTASTLVSPGSSKWARTSRVVSLQHVARMLQYWGDTPTKRPERWGDLLLASVAVLRTGGIHPIVQDWMNAGTPGCLQALSEFAGKFVRGQEHLLDSADENVP